MSKIIEFFNKNKENNRIIALLERVMIAFLLLGSLTSLFNVTAKINDTVQIAEYCGEVTLTRNEEAEDYDEDSRYCEIIFNDDNLSFTKTLSYEDYLDFDQQKITAHHYKTENGVSLCFEHTDPNETEIVQQYRALMAEEMMPVFNLGIALFILAISLAAVYFFSGCFSTYEKIWFVSIMLLATIFSVLFPEESANGVNGVVIMLLYLLDTFLNILCELLISKQSRYNFLVSILVEITEIAICVVLMYRFATMASTLFFWLPIDIISYINWSKHKDDEEDDLTIVRRLKGYQEALIIIGIILWTVLVGYVLSGLDIHSDFLGNNEKLETWMAYLDACASAVGIANGLFIFFRLREQWIAWYICALLEAIMNILSGQYVLLILKLGYFTNTTYGYIKWSRYIKMHKDENKSLF